MKNRELALGELCLIDWGNTSLTKKAYVSNGKYLAVSATGGDGRIDHYEHTAFTPVISAIGAQCGKLFLPEENFTAIKNTITLTPHQKEIPYENKYLFYLLSSLKLPRRGAGQPFISKGDLEKFKVSLPPLAEQQRISNILDKEYKLQKVYKNKYKKYSELLKSTFIYFFGEPSKNTKGWPSCTLGDLIHFAKDGPHVSPKYSDKDGIPFLSTRHVRPGEIIWEDMKFINQEEANRQWKKCKPMKGDILYTKGGTTGLAAEVKTTSPFAVWVHLALLRPNTLQVHPTWLENMLNSHYAYFQSQRYTHGIANKDLGLTRMKKIKMYLPPLSAQLKFVDFVRSQEKYMQLVSQGQSQLKRMISSTKSNFFSTNK